MNATQQRNAKNRERFNHGFWDAIADRRKQRVRRVVGAGRYPLPTTKGSEHYRAGYNAAYTLVDDINADSSDTAWELSQQ